MAKVEDHYEDVEIICAVKRSCREYISKIFLQFLDPCDQGIIEYYLSGKILIRKITDGTFTLSSELIRPSYNVSGISGCK